MEEQLQMRVYGDASLPTLVYLPGVHGDWTLISSFRAAVVNKVRFVEFTYPRTLAWSLEDYARAVLSALKSQGIMRGWLLAESFSSQVAWPMLTLAAGESFHVDGLILAGGFVRYPYRWMVRSTRMFCGSTPMPGLRVFLKVYQLYARIRFRNSPETLASIHEFVQRRTDLDRRAGTHRLCLIAQANPESIARSIQLPVYYLSGGVDPVVPWVPVRAWLRKNCPGLRGDRIIASADHNVLGSAAQASAEQVLRWMQESAQ